MIDGDKIKCTNKVNQCINDFLTLVNYNDDDDEVSLYLVVHTVVKSAFVRMYCCPVVHFQYLS